MFVCLVFVARCFSSSDLLSPFEVDINNTVNMWEYNGGVVVNTSSIMVSPPLKFCRGGIWTSSMLPEESWSVKVELGFTEISGGGFGIWVIDNYGDVGALSGGPVRFRGIGLIGRISCDNDIYSVDLSLLENNGKVNYDDEKKLKIDNSFVITDNMHVFIELSFNGNDVTVRVDNSNGRKLKKMIQKKISLDISKYCFGITTQSNHLPTRFDLYSVQFKANKDITKRNERIMKMMNKNGHFQHFLERRFKNENLNKLIEPFSGSPSYNDVLVAINEVNEVNNNVATFKDVNNFVIQKLVPYSQKWEKRTLKAVQKTRDLRNIVETANKITKKIIETFNETLISEMLTTK